MGVSSLSSKGRVYPPCAPRSHPHDTTGSPKRNAHRTCIEQRCYPPIRKLRSEPSSRRGYHRARAEIPCGVPGLCGLLRRRRRSGPGHPGAGRGLPFLQMACVAWLYYIAKYETVSDLKISRAKFSTLPQSSKRNASTFLGSKTFGHFLVHKNRTLRIAWDHLENPRPCSMLRDTRRDERVRFQKLLLEKIWKLGASETPYFTTEYGA